MTRNHQIKGGEAKRFGWRRGSRWLNLTLGALAVLAGGKAEPSIAARQVDYRTTLEIPPSWLEFASRLQLQFQQELTSDSDTAVRFHDAMSKLEPGRNSNLPTLIVRAWVMPDGKVERLELEGRQNEEALHDLYAVLTGDGVGAVPADMPQPLRLRLSLRPRARPEE
jgi:hypothetical protein